MAEHKCVICGFSFQGYTMKLFRKVWFCYECWQLRRSMIAKRKQVAREEFIKSCRDILKEVPYV